MLQRFSSYYFELTLQLAKCAIPRATSTATDVFISSVKLLVVLFPICARDFFKKSNKQPFSASSIITSRWSGDKDMNEMKPLEFSTTISGVRASRYEIFIISKCKITFLIGDCRKY